jgi:hypothetical protein
MFWEFVKFGVMVAVVVGVPVVSKAVDSRRRLKVWQGIAERRGLSVVKVSTLPMRLGFTARSGPVEMRITGEKDYVRVVATVEGPPELAAVSIRRDIIFLPTGREIETGDPKFDDTFVIKGPQPFVCALLDAQVRSLLMQAKDMGLFEISGGELRFSGQETELSGVLDLFRNLGQRFADEQELPRRLLENVRRDPQPGVRLQNLLVLIREYPGDPNTAKALHIGAKDSNVEVRLRAALGLGAEGRDILQKLAAGLEHDAVSAGAVTALGPELPLERLRSILGRARKERMAKTARACLEALASLGGAAVGTLAQVIWDGSPELAATAARGLGKIGDSAAEPSLLAALTRDNPELQEAAAAALGRVGTAAAVLPLQEAAERYGALRWAAGQAVAEIQARLEGASPGQLSLAAIGASEAGQLSLAAEDGQLSLAPHSTEQVPLPPPPQRTR